MSEASPNPVVFQKENMPELTYEEIVAWYAQYPDLEFREGHPRYEMWTDGAYGGEFDVYIAVDDVYRYSYSNTLNIIDPSDEPEVEEDPAPDPGDPSAGPVDPDALP